MRINELIRQARERFFIGRDLELDLFSTMLDPRPSAHVLFLYGPAGVGKTALLERFAQLGAERSAACHHLRLSQAIQTGKAFLEALALAGYPLNPPDDGQRRAILIDTLSPQSLRGLETWLSSEFIPQLSIDTVVVIAARRTPSKEWLADPGWNGLLRVKELAPLSTCESRQLLASHEVSTHHQDDILRFCQGYPLALTLCVRAVDRQPSESWKVPPILAQELLERLEVGQTPSSLHRAVLESAAVLRVISQSLLAHMLDLHDADELFDWLRRQEMIESVPRGLRPRSVAREALVAELRWRNPDRYREIHEKARLYYQTRLLNQSLQEQQAVLFDYFFLHRQSLPLRDRFVWYPPDGFRADAAEPADIETCVEMIARQEGRKAAGQGRKWLQEQLENAMIFRNPAGRVVGFIHFTSLTRLEVDDAEPSAQAALAYLNQRAPLRAGEESVLIRFWMDSEQHQGVTVAQSMAMVHILRHSLFTASLAFTFWAVQDAKFWAPLLAYAGFFAVDEPEGLYGHDWRSVPPSRWLDELAAREGLEIEAGCRIDSARPLLNKDEFFQAVRLGMRNFRRPRGLEENPLLETRLVLESTGSNSLADERIKALMSLFSEEVSQLLAEPKLNKVVRTLHATYLEPVMDTQEQVAEHLNLPFGTFRRHLAQSQDLLAEALWRREIAGATPLRLT